MLQWHKKPVWGQVHWRCQQWQTNALKEKEKKRAFKTILTKKIHASVNKEYDWHVYGSVADGTH